MAKIYLPKFILYLISTYCVIYYEQTAGSILMKFYRLITNTQGYVHKKNGDDHSTGTGATGDRL